MNRSGIAAMLASREKLNKLKARQVLTSLSHIIVEAVKNGQEVQFTGLGTFSAKMHGQKRGHAIHDTTRTIELPAMMRPRFRASRSFKKRLRNK